MTFTFNPNVPATGSSPAQDYLAMQNNYLQTENILAVDHVSFNNAAGGLHKQVTFNTKNTPGAQTDPQSVLYTANGVASTFAELNFVNQNATYPISLIKAYGLVTVSGGVPTIAQQINVASVVRVSQGLYTVTLNANVVSGTSYGVMVTLQTSPPNFFFSSANVTSATTFNINIFNADPAGFTFMVLQL